MLSNRQINSAQIKSIEVSPSVLHQDKSIEENDFIIRAASSPVKQTARRMQVIGLAFTCRRMVFFVLFMLLPLIILGISSDTQYVTPAFGTSQSINLSNNSGVSDFPRMAISGGNVYVAWYDDTPSSGTNEIFFKNSADEGSTFGSIIQLTNNSNQVTSTFPIALAAARAPSAVGITTNNVYIAWTDAIEGHPQLLYSRSTDGGKSFGSVINLSNDSGTAGIPWIAAPDDGSGVVHVVWSDTSNTTNGHFQVFYAKSTDGGKTFARPFALSNGTAESAFYPQIATSGNNICIIWSDQNSTNISTNIFGRSSANKGVTFGGEVNISNGVTGSFGNPNSLQFQNVAADGDKEYVVWNGLSPNGTAQIFMANSTNGGSTFGSPVDLSSDNGVQNGINSPQISSSPTDGKVYVVWPDSSGNSSQIFERSIIGGKPGKVVNLSNSTGNAVDPVTTTSSIGNVYIVWTDDYSGASQIYSIEISGDGTKFNGPIDVSNTSGQSSHSQVLTRASSVFIAWSDTSGQAASQDIFFTTNPTYTIPKISITHLSNMTPIWGTEISISGTTINAAAGESVTIDWGDNSAPTTGVAVSLTDGRWGPVFHTYSTGAIGTNPNNVIAKLVNNTDISVLTQSAQSPITIEKHKTALHLDPVVAVKQGAAIKLRGMLVDSDGAGVAVSNENILFSGSGGPGLSQTITAANGSFSVSGPSPNQPGDGWIVFASFAGNQSYFESNNTAAYDTASSSAKSISVPAGSNVHVKLNTTGFQSSIDFDEVSKAGIVYVSDCISSNTDRFIALSGLCVDLVPGLLMAENSSAHVHISYASKTLPATYSGSNVDLFQVDLAPASKIIDITESRDLLSGTVTGSTKTFSHFVAAVALHPDTNPPSDTAAKQVFVGSSIAANTVTFRNITAPIISLDRSSYSVGQAATITITDLNANANSSKVEIVKANVTSTSSSPSKLSLNLTESGAGTGVFTGHFTITSGPTSNSSDSLHSQQSDTLTVSYAPNPKPSLQAVFQAVNESGLVLIRDLTTALVGAPETIGSPVNMTVEGAHLGLAGYINVTMSYAGDFLGPINQTVNPVDIGIWQNQPGPGWVDITYREPAGHDLDAKVAKGRTTVAGGEFTLGVCPTGCGNNVGVGPGGGGGGLGIPGAIIVLDAIVPIAAAETGGGSCSIDCGGPSSSTSSGGSISSSSSSSLPPSTNSSSIPSGNEVETTIQIPGTNASLQQNQNLTGPAISLSFKNVTAGGYVAVTTKVASELPELFTNDTTALSTVQLNESTYTIVGTIVDVVPSSGLKFTGTVDVTIPYNETLVHALGANSSESAVRFLHFNGSAWEDDTIAINETANTVTGRLTSLSPVVAAVSDDNTFDAGYFEVHPVSEIVSLPNSIKLLDVHGKDLESATSPLGQPIVISNTIKNQQQITQPFKYIMEIIDQDGVTSSIITMSGSLQRGQSTELKGTWVSDQIGDYNVKMFVWTGEDIPEPLSDSTTVLLKVG